jgi:hypothetical protein
MAVARSWSFLWGLQGTWWGVEWILPPPPSLPLPPTTSVATTPQLVHGCPDARHRTCDDVVFLAFVVGGWVVGSAAALWASYKGTRMYYARWQNLSQGNCTLALPEGSCRWCSPGNALGWSAAWTCVHTWYFLRSLIEVHLHLHLHLLGGGGGLSVEGCGVGSTTL